MIYYTMLASNEHMLYAKEIAEKYNIFKNDKPNYILVTRIIEDYLTRHNIDYTYKFFLNRYHGMKKVYEFNIYDNAIKEWRDMNGIQK